MNTMTATNMLHKELESAIVIAGDLPAMPVVATKVMQLVEDERATAEELAKIVQSDPTMAARVLKISNSAFYGCQRQIQTLPSAIVVIGFNTLKTLVLMASVKEMFKPNGLTEKMLWEQSFGAALAARVIARETRTANPEEAFLAGLMQDIGKIIMQHIDPGKFQMVIEQYYNEGLEFDEAEKAFYSFSHAELGGCVLQKWNFPETLVSVVTHHHTFDLPDADDHYQRRMTAVASLANLFCVKLGIGERSPRADLELSGTYAAKLLKMDNERIGELLDNFAEVYERDKSYFS